MIHCSNCPSKIKKESQERYLHNFEFLELEILPFLELKPLNFYPYFV